MEVNTTTSFRDGITQFVVLTDSSWTYADTPGQAEWEAEWSRKRGYEPTIVRLDGDNGKRIAVLHKYFN